MRGVSIGLFVLLARFGTAVKQKDLWNHVSKDRFGVAKEPNFSRGFLRPLLSGSDKMPIPVGVIEDASVGSAKKSYSGDPLDSFVQSLVCVCRQIVRTRKAEDPNDNVCAEKYCRDAALDPRMCGRENLSELYAAGQLEKCVANNNPECYLYFPDASNRGVTEAYFCAIAHCLSHSNNTIAGSNPAS